LGVSPATHSHHKSRYEGPQLSTTWKILHILVLTSILLSSVPLSCGAPVELLQNGNFKNGLNGWIVDGTVFLDLESIRMIRQGSLSQTIRSPDLSFYLELSYGVRTELPSKKSFARSLVTFYVVDRQGKNAQFTIVGESYGEPGDSGWKDVRLNLLQLFRRDVGDPGNFQLSALKVAVELWFATSAVFPLPVAYFRNMSLKRVNPVKIVLSESGCRELPDRTELVISVTNVGDLDASNMVVTLASGPEIIVISGKIRFERSTLEGRTSWQLGWMLAARSSGVHPVTVRAGCDQVSAELSVAVPIAGIPQVTTTHISTVTSTLVEKPAGDQVIVVFVQMAFLVMGALLIVAIVIPLIQSRKRTELVFRLSLLRNRSIQAAFG